MKSMIAPAYYSGYGLTIKSDLRLPELEAACESESDVTIQLGSVPASLSNPVAEGVAWQAAPNQLLLRVHNVARYLITNGDTITIEPCASSGENDLRIFLLSSAWGALLHQRGFLTLHASAIATERGAVLFAGKSGAGKSTLATAMEQQGYALLSDDKTAITFDTQQRPIAVPAYPTRRLWVDSARRLGQPIDETQRLRANLNKYVSRVENFCTEPQSIHAIYLLQSHNRPTIEYEQRFGTDSLTALVQFTYRKKMLYGLGGRQSQFKMASALANAVQVIAVRRPIDPFMLDELVALVEEQIS